MVVVTEASSTEITLCKQLHIHWKKIMKIEQSFPSRNIHLKNIYIYINAETILEYCIFRWERNNRPPLFRSADRKHRIFRGFIVKRTLASGPVLQ